MGTIVAGRSNLETIRKWLFSFGQGLPLSKQLRRLGEFVSHVSCEKLRRATMQIHDSSGIRSLAEEIRSLVPVPYLSSPAHVDELAGRWLERQRVWHGPAHLLSLLREISDETASSDRDALSLAALYHDAVYLPKAGDNEEASAALFLRHAADRHSSVVVKAAEIIMDSKWRKMPASSLSRRFFEMDTRQLGDGCSLGERFAYEMAIYREFQFAPLAEYKHKRAEFLQKWVERFPQHRRGVNECVELLAGLNPRIAVYPGSFDPFHLGHLSILRQAERSFDKVIVAVGINRRKAASSDSTQLRFESLQSRLCFHEVRLFSGLLSEFLENLGHEATVVRGVRDGTDLEAELRFARFLNELRPGTNVVWIGCESELQHLSSSAVRELESFQSGAGERYVPDTSSIYDLVRAS
jgi:pantetheine-phosphate adenylyltransferase